MSDRILSRRRPVAFASLAGLTTLIFLVGSAVAVVPEGATFVDPSPIEVTLKPGESFEATLDVVNGSAVPVGFTIRLLNLVLAPGATELPSSPQPANGGVLAVTTTDIPPGGVWTASISLSGTGGEGTYAAQIVVQATDGTLDRRALKLTIAKAPVDAPTANPLNVPEPYPALTLTTTRKWFWGDDQTPADAARFYLGPDPAASVLPGVLVNENGETASIAVAQGTVVITAGGPGTYKGAIARAPQGTEIEPKKLTDVTLKVRDEGLGAFLLMLFVAIPIGLVLEWFSTDRLPRTSLRARLADLRSRARQAARDHEGWIEEQGNAWPNQRDKGAPQITAGDDGPVIDARLTWLESLGMGGRRRPPVPPARLYLDEASIRAESDFDALGALDTRNDRWGVKGSEYQKLFDAEAAYEKLLLGRQGLASQWAEYLARLVEARVPAGQDELTLRDRARQTPLHQDVVEALTGDVLTSADAITNAKTTVETLGATVGSMADVGATLATIKSWTKPGSDSRKKLQDLWEQLATVVDPETELEALRKAVRTLLDTVLVGLRPVRRPRRIGDTEIVVDDIRELGLTARSLVAAQTDFPLFTSVAIQLPRARVTPAVRQIEEPLETPADARAAHTRANFAYAIAVGALVIISGMATQYYAKDTFGSPSDYLAVLTWGLGAVTIGQFLKSAAGISGLFRKGA